ncbi:MAG: hypothetical protein ACTSVB_04800 [Candidatus Heimdallarchaeaceae archaeon]|uniref:Uncharacterized protein n=1 Tax=Candidatus Heimdallarchaeum endolithica TaxID=2876572 RepID=A0A9Y1FQ75_9ARCH|nr:MAG: hypothetical protein K9W46_06205 [Candidatus Heimdallarchaeum endolithica]
MTNILDFYVKCAFCKNQSSLKEAVLEEWKICNGCQLIFCKKCVEEYKNESICPGSVYTSSHQPLFSNLPVLHLLNLAKEVSLGDREGKYITRLFYEKKLSLAELLQLKMKSSQDEFQIIRFREEQWRKFGSVLVKRKDGKFISWGQI